MPEMIFILLLALLLFGPKKLPQVGRELGKALGEFKRASNEFTSQLETEIAQVEAHESAKAVSAPASPEFSGDPMRPPVQQPIQGETIEPRILPPSEPIVAAALGQAVESEPSQPKPPAADIHKGENAGSTNLNKAPLRESNA